MNRIFLGWDHPALPAAADVLLGRYTDGGACRLDGALVVFPGGRAGRRFKEVLEERSRAAGVRLVPPRVVTIGQLPELLAEASGSPASAAAGRLAWIDALRDTRPEDLSQVFARRPADRAIPEWMAQAAEIGRLQRDVAGAGLRFSDVAGSFDEQRGEAWDDSVRWIVLAAVQDRYEACLARAGLVDPDLDRIRAAARGRVCADFDVWLVGVAEMPILTRRLLEFMESRVHGLVHAPESIADRFDAFGCVVPGAWESVPIELDESRLLVADKPADQAEAVAAAIAEVGDAYAVDDVVIGVPSPDVAPWIAERLTAGGMAVRDAAGVEPSRTPPFRLLAAVADVLGSEDRWEPFAALARHPDVGDLLEGQGMDPEALLVGADRWYVEHLPERLPDLLSGAATKEGVLATQLVSALREGLSEPFRTAGRRTLQGWMDPILDVLVRVYGAREWRADRPSHRVAIKALEKLSDGIRAYRALPKGLDVECTAAEAIRLVLDQSAGREIANPQEHAAVELLGWLELHLDDAPVTVIAGANEPFLPESTTHHAFLPNGLCARLGITDNRMRYARDAYRLSAIRASRDRLVVVAGRWDAQGNPLRPSRLLFAADSQTVARRVRRFYDAEYAEGEQDGVLARGDGAAPVAGVPEPGMLTLPPEPEIRFEPPTRLSVTQFKSLLQDPYTWAVEHARGGKPVDDAAREMDGGVFGSLAHKVLERFGTESALHSDDEALVARCLDELLDKRVAEQFGPGAKDARIAVRFQVEQLRSRLRRVAAWHAGRIRDGWQVVGTEVSTPDDGVPFLVDGVPIGLKARIDRVEFHAGRGEWAVLDYKTGEKAENPDKAHRAKDGTWLDLQLPLYRWLLPQLTGFDGSLRFPVESLSRIRLGYVPVSAEAQEVSEVLLDWTDDVFEEALESARSRVRELRVGVFRFDPERLPKYADPRLEALLGLGLLTSAPAEEEEE